MNNTVYLIGIGMGQDGTLTEKARECINKSVILAGAERMVEPFSEQAGAHKKEVLISYKPDEIGAFFRDKLQDGDSGAVLLSGDVGFSSGAKKLMTELEDFNVELVPGITSMVYFCSKLGISWEDVCMASGHGKRINMIQRIKRHELCFFLMNGQKGLQELCDKLIYYGMDNVLLSVGENLSYENEKIVIDYPQKIKELEFGNLLVVITKNENAKNWTNLSISDDEFIRTKVPMTKSEIRTLSIGKLGLTSDAVVYDVGAGTGSVSVEMALAAPDIAVYAIEKNVDALELIVKNKQKFAADNIDIIAGTAPEALVQLPKPTHAFIGGSSGNMSDIIECIFEKNPKCRIVANTIALNTFNQLLNIFENNIEYKYDIVQLQTSYAKLVGDYQLMMGQNPIYIITIWKE